MKHRKLLHGAIMKVISKLRRRADASLDLLSVS